MVSNQRMGAIVGGARSPLDAGAGQRPAAARAANAGALPPAPLPARRNTRSADTASDAGSMYSDHSRGTNWDYTLRYMRPASGVSGGSSGTRNVGAFSDQAGADDVFATRVRRIERSLREVAHADADAVSAADIRAELIRQGGHAGRTLQSLLSAVRARMGIAASTGFTVGAREDAEGKPVLPEFMVAKIEEMATDTEVKAKQRAEIERKWKMIDNKGAGEISLDEFADLLEQLAIYEYTREAGARPARATGRPRPRARLANRADDRSSLNALDPYAFSLKFVILFRSRSVRPARAAALQPPLRCPALRAAATTPAPATSMMLVTRS